MPSYIKNLVGMCCLGMSFISMASIAKPLNSATTTAPSQEFWDYMADDSEDDGELLDMLDYEQIVNMKEIDADMVKENSGQKNNDVDASKLNAADKKNINKSSMQGSSSSFIKGAQL